MFKKVLFGLSTVALTAASAASSYTVRLYDASNLNGKELKAGEYRLELKDNMAILKQGKTVVQAPVTVQTGAAKSPQTAVRYVDGKIQEIRLGGTTTTLVFAN